MSEHPVTLETIAHMLGEMKAFQLALDHKLDRLGDASKTRDERLRGSVQSMQGDIRALSGRVGAVEGEVQGLRGDIVILAASGEVVEEDVRQITQSITGLTQLGMTNFDQNQSILESMTGAKGADRPKPQSRTSQPGSGKD